MAVTVSFQGALSRETRSHPASSSLSRPFYALPRPGPHSLHRLSAGRPRCPFHTRTHPPGVPGGAGTRTHPRPPHPSLGRARPLAPALRAEPSAPDAGPGRLLPALGPSPEPLGAGEAGCLGSPFSGAGSRSRLWAPRVRGTGAGGGAGRRGRALPRAETPLGRAGRPLELRAERGVAGRKSRCLAGGANARRTLQPFLGPGFGPLPFPPFLSSFLLPVRLPVYQGPLFC